MTYRTVTGKNIMLTDLKEGDIDIETIARGLAKQVRYNGQGNSDLTVLTHSMWVANTVFEETKCKNTMLLALLHDASEAYISDIHGGTKKLFTYYKRFEQSLTSEILAQLGIKRPTLRQHKTIKSHDTAIVGKELFLLFNSGNRVIKNRTEEEFIALYNQLKGYNRHGARDNIML